MDFDFLREIAKPSSEEAEDLQKRFKKQCKKAAQALLEADVLLVMTGAGFSADSGLAVYADVANVPAYDRLGVTYMDLCQPHWLDYAPQYFYGFWGQCFNDYRDTKPHNGYEIITKWRDDKNNNKTKIRLVERGGQAAADGDGDGDTIANLIRKRIKKERKREERKKEHIAEVLQDDEDSEDYNFNFNKRIKMPYLQVTTTTTDNNSSSSSNGNQQQQQEPAGAFFSFTSNVDAHWFDHCKDEEIYECHGNVEHWQCAKPYQCTNSGIWRAPLHHRFHVDQETMEAPPFTITTTTTTNSDDGNHGDGGDSAGSSSSCTSSSSSSEDDDHDDSQQSSDDEDDKDSIDRIFQNLVPTTTSKNKKKKRQRETKAADKKSKKKAKRQKQKKKDNGIPTSTVPVIGHVLGKGNRSNLLQNMPECTNKISRWTTTTTTRTDAEDDKSNNHNYPGSNNWPKCGKCLQLARPAILMFDDMYWLPDKAQQERWRLWRYSVLKLCKKQKQQQDQDGDNGNQKKATTNPQPQSLINVCIVEIGCGMNVPTCRLESERIVEKLIERDGGNPTLIRINPDYPLVSNPQVTPFTIPIMSRGLGAIQKIDYYYQKKKKKKTKTK